MATDSIDRVADIPLADANSGKDFEKFQYPGIPTTCDGAEAIAWVETRISQGSGAFPITSSTTMATGFNQAQSAGVPNLWGDQLVFVEPESEHSSATFCEGFALAGGRVTNFTSGQGLVLMKEVLYTIAGKRLPVVFNIGARALTSQGLNVHAGHDDVMSVADVGWGVLFARNAQEAGDLCLIARRAAEASQTPFLNCQDGFLTTHTVESVRLPEPEFMKEFIGKPEDKLMNLMDPANPLMSGVVQNQDSYMKGKIAQRWYYDQVAPALTEAFEEFHQNTGRRYDFVDAYRCADAEYVIVGASICIASGRSRGSTSSASSRTASHSPCWNAWTTPCRRRATISRARSRRRSATPSSGRTRSKRSTAFRGFTPAAAAWGVAM
jgi:pyruvate-ferredoxin/flavodoxin oxidoreductase